MVIVVVHEGHLRVVQGRGTFVRELVLDYALKRRTRLTENLAEAELFGHAATPGQPAAFQAPATTTTPPRGTKNFIQFMAGIVGPPHLSGPVGVT